MSAQVYTELFKKNRSLVEKNSCRVLNEPRGEALKALEELGFPTVRTEEFLHTDISSWLEPDWGMNLGRLAIPVHLDDVFHCSVPNLSTLLYYLADDHFVASGISKHYQLPEGVIIGGLDDVAAAYPELVEKYYSKLADIRHPGIAALNTLFAQDGFVVYIPDGVVLDKPVQLVTLLQSPVDLMVTRRLLVIAGRGSNVRLLLCDHSSDNHKFLTTQVAEVFAGEDSHIEIYDMEETSSLNNRISELYLNQESGSDVSVTGITLHNGNTRNSSYVTLSGRGASLHLDGVAIVDGNQHIDNNTFVDHLAADCQSNELFKYVLDDSATGSFAGKVLVREGSAGTVSQQTNRNICLTRDARMFTQPQLEIYADDVKCSHGATVGQLDENALFYMRQRGIPEKDARTLLMMAFVDDVIGRIDMEPLRQRLRYLVERRFKGGSALCEGCNICK